MIIMQKLLVVVVSLALLLLLTSHTQAYRRRLNCRLQVFHPRCRGASAKRSGADYYPPDDAWPGLQEGGDDPADSPPMYSSDIADLPSRTQLDWPDSRSPDISNNQAMNLVKLLVRLKAALQQRGSDSNRQPYESAAEDF